MDRGVWDTVVIGAGLGHRFSGHLDVVVTLRQSSVCGRLAMYLVAGLENTASVALCDFGLGCRNAVVADRPTHWRLGWVLVPVFC